MHHYVCFRKCACVSRLFDHLELICMHHYICLREMSDFYNMYLETMDTRKCMWLHPLCGVAVIKFLFDDALSGGVHVSHHVYTVLTVNCSIPHVIRRQKYTCGCWLIREEAASTLRQPNMSSKTKAFRKLEFMWHYLSHSQCLLAGST